MPRRPAAGDDFSLFPFLSIIASVIGVLTMMIATLALAQTDAPTVARVERYESLQSQSDRLDRRADELRRQIEVAADSDVAIGETQRRLAATAEELDALLAELERVERELREQKAVQIVIPPIDESQRETLDDLRRQASDVRQSIDQLRRELDGRAKAPEAEVRILPQGSGIGFDPRFIECAADSIVLHTLDPPVRIRTGKIGADQRLLDLLTEVSNAADQSVVLMVRSDGLGTYRRLHQMCNQTGVRQGKIPIVGDGKIDLSAFARDGASGS